MIGGDKSQVITRGCFIATQPVSCHSGTVGGTWEDGGQEGSAGRLVEIGGNRWTGGICVGDQGAGRVYRCIGGLSRFCRWDLGYWEDKWGQWAAWRDKWELEGTVEKFLGSRNVL